MADVEFLVGWILSGIDCGTVVEELWSWDCNCPDESSVSEAKKDDVVAESESAWMF